MVLAGDLVPAGGHHSGDPWFTVAYHNFLTLHLWVKFILNCNDKIFYSLHLYLYLVCNNVFLTPVGSYVFTHLSRLAALTDIRSLHSYICGLITSPQAGSVVILAVLLLDLAGFSHC